MVATEEELQKIKDSLDGLRKQIPPKWVAWLFGLLISSGIVWGTWVTTCVIRLEGGQTLLSTSLMEHRALPIHPGASEQLTAIRREISDMRVTLQTTVVGHETRLDNLESGKTIVMAAETRAELAHVIDELKHLREAVTELSKKQ